MSTRSCVLVVFVIAFALAVTADANMSSFDWNGVWASQGPCSHTSCCCFVKADTQVLPDNKLNVTGVMEGKICPTFKSTYNIQLIADLSANHSSAEISLIFGLYNIVITPRGANAMFAKDPRSACDNLMVRG